jgi:hypothetical protein
MPTFPTPDPIVATIEITGDVRITASDRTDTVVTVRPNDPDKAADVRAAEEATVELVDGRLVVKSQRSWRMWTPFGGNAIIEVAVELPTGSQVVADSAFGNLAADGELGACRLKSAMGTVRVDRASGLRASSGYGNITIDHVSGDADVNAGSGDVRIDRIDGAAKVKSGNGDVTIGEVLGELRAKAANGDITVGRAHTSAMAKTANGDVRFDEVREGAVVAETAAGTVDIGVLAGTAAWLDLDTKFGKVRNQLGGGDAPAPSGRRVEIRAHTSIGDITIDRAPGVPAGSTPTPSSTEGTDAR